MECQRCTKCDEVHGWSPPEDFRCLAQVEGTGCHGTDAESVDLEVIDERSLLTVAKEHSKWFYRTLRHQWDQYQEEWIDLKHIAGVETVASPPGNIVIGNKSVQGVEEIRQHYGGLRARRLLHRYRAISLRLFGLLEFVFIGLAVFVDNDSSLGLAGSLVLVFLAWVCDGIRSKNRYWKARWN